MSASLSPAHSGASHTFSMGKSRRGEDIAAAAASCARDLPGDNVAVSYS